MTSSFRTEFNWKSTDYADESFMNIFADDREKKIEIKECTSLMQERDGFEA